MLTFLISHSIIGVVTILLVATIICISCYAFNQIRLRYFTSLDTFRGQTVVLTGANSGIGFALACELYYVGAQLILVGRDVSKLATTVQQIESLFATNSIAVSPPSPIIIQADLSLPDLISPHPIPQSQSSTSSLPVPPPTTTSPTPLENASVSSTINSLISNIRTATSNGLIDMVICCAGISMRDLGLNVSSTTHQKLINTNYVANVELVQGLLQNKLLHPTCRIVVISSIQGLLSIPLRSAYAASKFALQGYFTSIRHEMAMLRSKMSVTIVSPGYVATNLSLNALVGNGQTYNVLDGNTESGAQPSDIAHLTLLAASQRLSDLWLCPLSHKAIILLQYWVPSLVDKILQKRGKKYMSPDMIANLEHKHFY